MPIDPESMKPGAVITMKPGVVEYVRGSSGANGLTILDRLQAASIAASFVLQVQTLKAPLLRLILEEVRRLLGED